MAEVAVEYLIAKLEDWITKETNKQDGKTQHKFKKLLLVNFEELEEWTKIEIGSMKNLQSLVISKCPKLKQQPQGLESLVDLQVLHIKDMPAEFVRLARETSSNSALHFSVSC